MEQAQADPARELIVRRRPQDQGLLMILPVETAAAQLNRETAEEVRIDVDGREKAPISPAPADLVEETDGSPRGGILDIQPREPGLVRV